MRELHAACIAGEAMPGASVAFRNLRRELEAPREGRDSMARPSRSQGPTRRWWPWAIAAEFTVIVVLGRFAAGGHRRSGSVSNPRCGKRWNAGDGKSRRRIRSGDLRSGGATHPAQRRSANRGRPDPGECVCARDSPRADGEGRAGNKGRARYAVWSSPLLLRAPDEHHSHVGPGAVVLFLSCLRANGSPHGDCSR